MSEADLRVQTEQADLARVDELADRVTAGSVQVLLKLARLYELARRRVRLEGLPRDKVVVPPVGLRVPAAARGVCPQNTPVTCQNAARANTAQPT